MTLSSPAPSAGGSISDSAPEFPEVPRPVANPLDVKSCISSGLSIEAPRCRNPFLLCADLN